MPSINSTKAILNSKKTIAAASMMCAAGSAVFLLLPILIGALVDSGGFTESDAGLLSSVYFTGYMVSATSAFFWIRKINWRNSSACGYGLLIVGLLLSAFETSFSLLALYLFISGAGAGILFGLGVTLVSDTEKIDRNFGCVLAVQQLLAAILFFTLSNWISISYGLSGILVSLGVVMAILSLSLAWIPARGEEKGISSTSSSSSGSLSAVRIGLLALVVHFAALSAVWAFVERFAVGNQLVASDIGSALAIAMLGGLLGGVAAAVFGDRFGQRRPLWISTLAFIVIYFIYYSGFDWLLFVLATAVFSFMWNYVLAYQMGILSKCDHDGRHAVLIPAAQAVGAMIGPVLGGSLLLGGLGLLLSIASVLLIIAISFFVYLAPVGACIYPAADSND